MTERPLYAVQGKHPGALPETAHAGLWYDKFCFAIARSGDQGVTKQEWIEKVTKRCVGDASLIAELCGRQRRMIEHMNGALVHIEATTRFVTGLGRQHPVDNGFAWHPVLGTPYVPGSSLKGMVRAWARSWLRESDRAQCERMLGTPKCAGTIEFLDAIPAAPTQLEADVTTPHYGPYYQKDAAPGDWHRPVPVPFLVVAAGTCMQLGIVPTNRAGHERADIDSTIATVKTWIVNALRDLGAGAKTAVGYGRFRPYDGSELHTSWVEDLRARRIASLPLIERVRHEVAALNEQESMQLVKARMEMQEPVDPAYHEALRQVLFERFHDQWATRGMGNVSDKKRKQYLRWLRGEAEPVTPEAATSGKKEKKKKEKKKRKT